MRMLSATFMGAYGIGEKWTEYRQGGTSAHYPNMTRMLTRFKRRR